MPRPRDDLKQVAVIYRDGPYQFVIPLWVVALIRARAEAGEQAAVRWLAHVDEDTS